MEKNKSIKALKDRIDYNPKRDKGIISKMLFSLYHSNFRFIRTIVLKVFYRYVGSHCEYYSLTLRKLFSHYHKVNIGMFSHGGCFMPGKFPEGTTFGRYCSITRTCSALNVNHPMNLKSSHAFFFNPILGYSGTNIATYNKINIGNDVWIGDHAILLPSCTSVGDGAIIGAGAVVNKNIPPYAIAVGNPARVVRFRFSEEKRKEIMDSKWWDKPMEEIFRNFEEFQTPIEAEVVR